MRSSIALGLAVLVSACTATVGDDPVEGADAGTEPLADAAPSTPDARAKPDEWPLTYDVNRLLDDDQIFGGEDISIAQVQDFLVGMGSFLADYTDPISGKDAATIIVERSRFYGVSPLYMIARVQTESSLISSGSSDHLEAATGCGCPDGGGCNPELGGFGNQIECAAEKMFAYAAELDEDGVTRAGWQVGVARMTMDPCTVTPVNRATAMLYTYTPWVGAYGDQCGTAMWGGSSLVALAYHRYWVEYPWGTEP